MSVEDRIPVSKKFIDCSHFFLKNNVMSGILLSQVWGNHQRGKRETKRLHYPTSLIGSHERDICKIIMPVVFPLCIDMCKSSLI